MKAAQYLTNRFKEWRRGRKVRRISYLKDYLGQYTAPYSGPFGSYNEYQSILQLELRKLEEELAPNNAQSLVKKMTSQEVKAVEVLLTYRNLLELIREAKEWEKQQSHYQGLADRTKDPAYQRKYSKFAKEYEDMLDQPIEFLPKD